MSPTVASSALLLLIVFAPCLCRTEPRHCTSYNPKACSPVSTCQKDRVSTSGKVADQEQESKPYSPSLIALLALVPAVFIIILCSCFIYVAWKKGWLCFSGRAQNAKYENVQFSRIATAKNERLTPESCYGSFSKKINV